MSIQAMTPAQTAAGLFRLMGGNFSLEAIARSYTSWAQMLRQYAVKAAASKSGKFHGYTEAQALALAEDQAARAVSVPAELSKLVNSLVAD